MGSFVIDHPTGRHAGLGPSASSVQAPVPGADLEELLRRAQLNGHVDRHVKVQLTDRQRAVLTLINEEPALNIRELADRMRVQRTAAKHHVANLLARGLVLTHRQGRHVLHFTNWMAPHERAALAALRIGSVRAVVAEAFRDPEVRMGDLPGRLGLKPRTIRASVRLLRQAGLVHLEKVPGTRTCIVHLDRSTRITWARWFDASRDRVGPAPLRGEPTRAMAIGLFFLSWLAGSSS